MVLLIELFGEKPGKDLLTGVVIDRACDVDPYTKERLHKKEFHILTYC